MIINYLFTGSLMSLCFIAFVKGDRESECTEVGFARSAGSMIHQSFDAVREVILPRWQQEDVDGQPSYKSLSSILKNVTRTGQILEESSKLLLSKIRKTRVGKRCPELWLLRGIEKHVVPLMNLDKPLSEELGLVMSFRCLMGSPYPNVDGSCINQESPDLGSIGSKFLRLLPATPGMDGFSLRGSASSDKQLPSSRTISKLIRKHMEVSKVTDLFKQWAHFIQRDSFGIPESPLVEDTDCCLTPDLEDCAAIPLDKDDPEFTSIPCINYKRSARAQAILGHRESMSVISTYLDATPVYGSTNEAAFIRKSGFFGYLKVVEDDEKELERKENEKCDFPNNFKECFAKDNKLSFVPGLQYLFALEHNRLADALIELNPHFDDSLLYNEARRIMIAEYNAVTFGEYLNVLLGEELVAQHNLAPGSEGPSAQFIPQVNPGILAGFAVAAYRNPSMYTEWRSDMGVTDLLDSVHYNSVREDKYRDMLAMDVQRSRDHAVPGYLPWRRFCDSGRPLDTWEDLEKILPEAVVSDLKTTYQGELEDIDMSVALLEPPSEGGITGKTFSCILADQYARLRTGNRLYWEHDSAMFTVEQRNVIKETTAASLMCRNLPLEEVPQNPFLPATDKNPFVKCKDVPAMDMSFWKDISQEKTEEIENTGEDGEIIAEPLPKPNQVDDKPVKNEDNEEEKHDEL